MEDEGMEALWSGEGRERIVKDERLDRIDRPFWLDDSKSWVFVIFMVMAVPWVFGAMFWWGV
jgi:hypothetical protein